MSEPHLIGGRYEVGELLGRGGMAEVRKGRDVRLGRTVAIKRLRTDRVEAFLLHSPPAHVAADAELALALVAARASGKA